MDNCAIIAQPRSDRAADAAAPAGDDGDAA
jgi:hypothetical protein